MYTEAWEAGAFLGSSVNDQEGRRITEQYMYSLGANVCHHFHFRATDKMLKLCTVGFG